MNGTADPSPGQTGTFTPVCIAVVVVVVIVVFHGMMLSLKLCESSAWDCCCSNEYQSHPTELMLITLIV